MAENILLLLFSVPAIIGLAEIIHTFKLLIISPKKAANGVLVICPDDNDFAGQLLCVSERCKWLGNGYANKVIVINSSLCPQDKKECDDLALQLGFIVANGQEVLEDFFKKEEVGG